MCKDINVHHTSTDQHCFPKSQLQFHQLKVHKVILSLKFTLCSVCLSPSVCVHVGGVHFYTCPPQSSHSFQHETERAPVTRPHPSHPPSLWSQGDTRLPTLLHPSHTIGVCACVFSQSDRLVLRLHSHRRQTTSALFMSLCFIRRNLK